LFKVDPNYFRPTEVDILLGDPTRQIKFLAGKPKYSLEDLIVEMVRSDLKEAKKERFLIENGYRIKQYYE
jgi:GDPmannose 4,6-dehydratase